jgi:hypothetical protein
MKNKKNILDLIPCQCCGAKSIEEQGSYEICPVCFWEDDGITDENVNSGANHLTLKEARENYKKYKACSIEFVNYVKKINDDDFK